MEIPKISVLIICYKQEELIKRAINSLLAQKDYIYEICVSDDCSSDRTWDVLLEYDKLYPGLFKLHQNYPNIGIFENIEHTWTMPTGDIIYRLAGDDECGEGWFKSVIEYIHKNNIDYKNELFCIYGDYLAIYPNGDKFIRSNRLAGKYQLNSLSLSIRTAIGPRSACYSINILKKFVKVSQGRSYIAEDAIDKQMPLNTEKSYYIPKVGNIYYASIGVCVNMSNKELNGRVDIFKYSYTFLKSKNALSKKDEYYMLFKDALLRYKNHKSLKSLAKILKLLILGFVPKYDLHFAVLQRLLFAIRRRIPHRKPLVIKIG